MEENSTKERPNYYAVIPANVRYDKELTPNAKLLYAEITALTNEKGYCWANNNYFSKLYKVSKVSISKWINQLDKKGYIQLKLVYKKKTKQIQERRLYIVDPIKEKFNTPQRKVNDPIKEKFNTPIKEKFKDNNTSINNKSNIKEKIYKKEKYFEDENLNNLFIDFLEMRKKLKAVNSDRAITILINKLEKYNDETKYKMIEQSIENSWKGLFELKKDKPYQQEVKEKVPEWFGKEIKEEKLSKEEEKEMEEMLKEFK